MNIIRLYHTVKYLRPVQITQRLVRKFRKLSLYQGPVDQCREVEAPWQNLLLAPQTFFEDDKAVFLNKPGRISLWEKQQQTKIWFYNLHYFDDLSSIGCESRRPFQQQIVQSWINANPPLMGTGWEPYPNSLRVVNWIKALLNGWGKDKQMEQSLFQQAYVLYQDIEYHLLGNHLFTNAKSLIFCGLYFKGELADKWLHKGLAILDKEIPEQILKDGGSFELSPMYHNIILADMLDLIQLCRVYAHPELSTRVVHWREVAHKMLFWMRSMSHPDGDVALFNDAALGIARQTAELTAYASSLDINIISKNTSALVSFIDSGYSTVDKSNYKVIFDHGNVGPDYLPGHAHADTLSFECSFGQQRVFVNSGTSVYGTTAERHRQRQTASHNTVEVDGQDSSEVWSGFRVARRAYGQLLDARETENTCYLSGSHNGYVRLPGKVTHTRSFTFDDEQFSLVDQIDGQYQQCRAFFYLHPDIMPELLNTKKVILTLPNASQITVDFEGGEASIVKTTWHPRFGQSVDNRCMEVRFSGQSLTTKVTFNDKMTTQQAPP
jgi:uncharacterized heparinase superfamily protein